MIRTTGTVGVIMRNPNSKLMLKSHGKRQKVFGRSADRDARVQRSWQAYTNNEFWPSRQYEGRKMGYLPPESFPRIYERLFKIGYSEKDIELIFGGNFFRISKLVWN